MEERMKYPGSFIVAYIFCRVLNSNCAKLDPDWSKNLGVYGEHTNILVYTLAWRTTVNISYNWYKYKLL